MSESVSLCLARGGRRRRFNEGDKQLILEEAMRPDARFSEVARRHGVVGRVLLHWKQELPPDAVEKFSK
jgi:transposase-like protein